MKKIIAICLLFCAAFVFADPKAMPRFEIPTAQSSGMGGAHVAYTDNVFSLLVNPAAMIRVQQRSFFAISPTMLSPQTTFDLITPILDTTSGDLSSLGGAADILSKKNGKIPLGFDLREFPLSIAWVANGFGFGLWDRIFVNANIIGENIQLNSHVDMILPFGFGFRILDTEAHSVDAGVTIKPFTRIILRDRVRITSLMDDDFDFFDTMSAPLIFGAGFDLGFLYRWNIGLSAGITFDDIITRGGVVTDFVGNDAAAYYVPFSMNLGLAYDCKLGQFWTTAPNFLANLGFTFAFDWHDFTNVFQQDDYTKRNAALNIGMGFQVSMHDMFKVRFGMNEMLPAIGVGFDFGPIELDAAYYGKELGLEPGQLSTAALDLTFAVRPGAKKRDWPWTQISLVSLIQNLADSK